MGDFNSFNEFILVILVPVLQARNTLIQVQCPACGKKESIMITESELLSAREQHSLITKAISHTEEEHVLTLYIDGQGIIRRKYCFEIAKNRMKSNEHDLPQDLTSIFGKMIKDSMK